MNFENSRQLLERAWKVIPSATQTFSKGPNQWPGKVSPNYLQKGEGAWVWDVDGNKFLDYLMALGPIILGYNNTRVNEAVTRQLKDGTIFSQMHPLEVEVAEMICDLIPCAEMVRFGKNGSDATTAAVRVARAFTGRERVAICGYHGWHDWYIGTTTRDLGIPAAVKTLSHTFPYNDLDVLEQLFTEFPGEFAAVVMEPMGVEDPHDGYLSGVKTLCEKHGVVLVFDEIVSGFRVGMEGAQAYFGVIPHLACFGKAMANGLPISAVTGRRDIMEVFDRIFFSGTFGGDTLALAACKATIQEMQEHDVIGHNWEFGEKLSAAISQLISAHSLEGKVRLLGLPVRSIVAFPGKSEKESLLRRSYFMQECIKRGLLYFCSHIPCYAHGDEELEFTLNVLEEVFALHADAESEGNFSEKLDGPMIQAIFRRA